MGLFAQQFVLLLLFINYELGPALGTKREPCENHGLTRNCNSAPTTSEKCFWQNKTTVRQLADGKVAKNQRSQETYLIHIDCFREMKQNQIDEFI